MASEHRWIVVHLCVWLAAVDSILSVEVELEQPSSNPPELRDANYIQLQDLIRKQIRGLIDNGADMPNAGALPEDVPTGMQVRHLGGPRGRRWRNLIFGSEDGTQSGLMSKFRRPPPQSNRVEGMYDYFDDNVGADYQNRYPSYDYPPSRNQMMYDMNGRRPNAMWSGSGVSSDGYMLNDSPPPRGSFRRPAMRPLPSESYSFMDNGDQMQTIESLIGGPGTYLVQVPARGRRNNLNGGQITSAGVPSTQTINSGSDGYTVIPIDLSGLEGFSNGGGLPIRISGNGNSPNQVSRVSVPGAQSQFQSQPQSIVSTNTGVPDLTNIEVAPVSGGQHSSQTFTIPSVVSGSGANKVQQPRVEVGGDGMNLVPSVGKNQISRVSIPSSQSIIPENLDMLDAEGLTSNVKLPSVNAGLPSAQKFSIPTGTSGPGGNRIQIPFTGNDGLNMNSLDVLPEVERMANGAGIPTRVDGKRNSPNQVTRVSIPDSQFSIPENVDLSNMEGLTTNIKIPSMNGGQSSQQTFTIPTGSIGSGGSRIQLPVNEGDLQYDEGLLRNMELPANLNRLTGESGSRVISGVPTELPGLNGFRIGSDGSGLKGLNNLELPTGGSGMRPSNSQIQTAPSSVSYNFGGGEPISTVGLPMDTSRTPASFRMTSSPTSIQSSPTVVSMSETDTPPEYDIDIRHVEEPSYSTSTTESSNVDSPPITTSVTQTVSNQPSELVSTMIPDIESPMNLVNQEVSLIMKEPTNLVSDMSPSKMLTATEDSGRALVKGASKSAGGFFPSFRWSKSSKPSPAMSIDENEILANNVADMQSNVDEQMNARLPEPEILTDGVNKNTKIQMEPGMSTMKFVQNGPQSFNMNGNLEGTKRRGANQQGSYYIIQRPDEFSNIFGDQAENYENQLRPQTSRFGTRSQVQQSMGDMGAQNVGIGQAQNAIKGGKTRMMSSAGAGEGSGALNVGAGRPGRQRQYKVLVVDGDHEILRGLNLPGMKSADSAVSGEA